MEDGFSKNEKKSWTELKQTLCELRRQLSALSCVVPSSVDFKNLPDGSTRIYFLGTLANGWETTLYYTDIPCEDNKGSWVQGGRLQWNQLLEWQSGASSRGSREEQLLFERKRLTTWGITSYQLHPASSAIVFPANGTIYQAIHSPNKNLPLYPSEIRTNVIGSKISPVTCPSDPNIIAFVCNLDIWVAHIPSGSCEKVSNAHKGLKNLANDPLSAGVPSYVMQEEFSRYDGFWWQPRSSDDVHRLLYEEVDDSEVGLYSFPSSMTPFSGEVEQYRFPRAGSKNSKSNLKLAEIRFSHVRSDFKVTTLELSQPLSHWIPWMEYLVRVGWTPDSNNIWVEALDRKQERLELLLLPVSSFVSPELGLQSPLPAVIPVASQTCSVWINVHDLIFFMPNNSEKQEIIWASEESGYRHLCLVTLQNNGSLANSLDHPSNPGQRKVVPLTQGEWEVVDCGLRVDVVLRLVYFMALRETPLEKHLYVASLDNPGDIRLLTIPGFSYTIDIDQDCTICVATYSNVEQPPVCQVFRICHTDGTVAGVSLTRIGYLLHPQLVESWVSPELHSYKISSGDVLFAMVFKPHNYLPGVAYPTVLNVYGGPEVQTVSNTFKGMRYLRNHMLASQGYCVVMIDSRGSLHRGLAFESHIKHRMGMVELEDQVEVLNYLKTRLDMIDMNRLAIYGWSYGGYLSLMALARFQHIFKVCIAGAPVTSWLLYDTAYTERYMGLPEENPQGYKDGSILTYVNQFPDQENRLLIIHGLIDENVHFTHTSTLISHLVSRGKPYQLQIYPGERHSLRSLDASKHYETVIMSFLQKHL